MKKILIVCTMLLSVVSLNSEASDQVLSPKHLKWPFTGMLGSFDKASIQRGFQVYKTICHTCHSLQYLSYRNLEEVGFSAAEVKEIASEFEVSTVDDQGNPTTRKALPSDRFVKPFANEQAARAANGGSIPPDQSLLIKARERGPDYLYSLLTGYTEAPAGEEVPTGKYYNPYFAAHFIAMPPPLQEGILTYEDGTDASVDQMARDVVNFLQWTAEPEMEYRKRIGIKVLLYLSIFTIIFYIAKRRVWSKLDK
ncbi:Cytochrome c1 precursor [Rickettsiales bacterium Ac37b]|nr:Cytochrome c1 precursor [Rickettsiales bacterium Ac37b]